MDILIAGGSGLIGTAFTKYLLDLNISQDKNYHITFLGRNKYALSKLAEKLSKLHSDYEKYLNYITWRELEYSEDNIVNTVAKFDLVMNLSGQNIGAQRWNDSFKRDVINSRVRTTKLLAKACAEANKKFNKNISFYNASAIGVYGLANQEQVYTESSSLNSKPTDFLAQVGQAWEEATKLASDNGVRTVILRFAVVLDWQKGALKRMLTPFKLGVGGRIGSGEQPFSWIAIEDLVRALVTLIDNQEVSGPINLVAPKYTNQISFAKGLSGYLHRPCIAPMPAFVVKLIFGEMGEELLLNGQKVESVKLDKYYKDWLYPDIEAYFK